MDRIIIKDLEVHFRVGVPAAERAQPQRLLISVEMEHDARMAAGGDNLEATIDYYAVTQDIIAFGKKRTWKLIESLADELAAMVLRKFEPISVEVEVKKFIIQETRHVAVVVQRRGGGL